jgi:hypothetical protein
MTDNELDALIEDVEDGINHRTTTNGDRQSIFCVPVNHDEWSLEIRNSKRVGQSTWRVLHDSSSTMDGHEQF